MELFGRDPDGVEEYARCMAGALVIVELRNEMRLLRKTIQAALTPKE